MSLPELSINRHVLAWMLSGLLVLFGLISYQRIGVDRFPTVDFPMISVTTILPGADPEIVDASITSIIEEKVNSVPGIEHVISYSSPGVSVVTVQFELAKDVNVAFNEVQAKVNQVLRDLPDNVDPPIVGKVEIGAAPIMWLTLTGERTLQQLNQYARNVIKKRLENISGVGEVQIGGERQRTIRIWLDLDRMQGFGIGIPHIMAAMQREHVQFPGGFLSDSQREYMMKLDMEFHNVDELANLAVRSQQGATIHLKDIARIEDGLADFRQFARFNGQPTVGLGIIKVTGANVVAIATEAKRRLNEEIIPQLPPGMQIHIATNDADIVQGIVDGLKDHLIESVLLATLIVLAFLRNLRATLIVSTAIPVSMLASIAVAYFFGFTLNLMSLLALLLLIGVVVDDAIVVLENIFRHREEGLAADARTAALNGSRQVTFAVIAASLTLISIFAPVIFMDGMIGRFFNAFAVTVTFGVMASLLVSLTLVPMLASRYMQEEPKHGALYRFFGRLFDALDRAYRHFLNGVLRFRWLVLAIAIGIFLASTMLFGVIGKGFVPEEDEGRFMIIFKLPLGASIEETQAKVSDIEKVLTSDPDITSNFTTVGLGALGQVNQGISYVRLTPKTERVRRQWEILPSIQKKLDQIPGIQAFAVKIPIVGGQRGEPLQFSITGPDLHEVARVSNIMRDRLLDLPGIGSLDLDLQLDLPQLALQVDRDRASQLGLSAIDVAQSAGVLVSGMNVAKFNDQPGDGRRYDIRMQAEQGMLKHAQDLSRIYLMTAAGEKVRLDTIASWQQKLGPATIAKMDLRYAGLFFSAPSIPLGAAIESVNAIGNDILPPGYRIIYTGQAAEFAKTARNMLFAFAVALLLVFMVQASQFNSFAQPWVLILAQPMAIAGAIGMLVITNQTLNIFSMIGLVLLVGLVAKNSILLVDLTNQYRTEGMGIDEALKKACPTRMRPVLMTSLTIIFAMLPTALGLGSGSEMTVPMSVAVIGGMISSTLLTLAVVPAAYSLLEHKLERWQNRSSRL
ncbi:MAG: AcrB/AcrD/AcrF family protein [Zetaproteobacteria bacterium CG_4_9_14_3_um_filter_49_83]|nr:MAG: acriflavin resistance protein [Zetaproteobacteria bacterium CG1_02_49_23]PIQ34405.1 MAG: acriflavin resistance protein [Zetaproteobacteria bacterium CG17_big_fil_post_rev_8_21_14_2_50_50_13]PIV30279.1 MAG: AcrB/AcrD/AcrF family protein [Zetaproteobacteria bacterium CG02_land_8_20_14_3_00_50_9]PIY56389.1 MAG: AcrB/AcrD/AcrF family protein [Zetaproteobacteria bacterium CG_4_10_14_0_8_um_filter_49_80]PJA34029.1 MAG: AcrB/AcrD/AcrF family protein [Zetaproteobacteria bacterium CG_4_9_14_3_um